jgi:tetratricopeptide (TPR) repeat protein
METEKYMKQALGLEPENTDFLVEYANFLVMMKRGEEARAIFDKARKLAPDSPLVNDYFQYAMIHSREFDKVKPLIKKEIREDPQNPYLYWKMAVLCSKEGKPEEALENLSLQIPMMNGDMVDEVALCGYNLGRMGKTEEALAQLKKLDELAEKGMYVSPAVRAWIYSGLNNRDEAMACLEKGFTERAHRMGLDLIAFAFIFESVSDDPRYQELLKKMNL